MEVLVVYDSVHGNTAEIAKAIADAVGGQVIQAAEANPGALDGVGLLIVGSPTHGGWYTEGIRDLLKTAPSLEGVKVVAFDTRTVTIWNRILPFGYAAPRISQHLEGKGGMLLAPPEGFVVLGTKGPLKDGELERAADWAEEIVG